MKSIVLFAALTTLAAVGCSKANNQTTAETKRVVDRTWQFYLNDCEGTLQANLSDTNQISMVVRGSQECSNLTLYALGQTKTYKIPENGNGRSGSFTVPSSMIQRDGTGSIEVTVHSNSRAHSDTRVISYDIAPAVYMTTNTSRYLSDCGGSVAIKAWSDGRRQLEFRNVQQCSNVYVSGVGSYKLNGSQYSYYGTIDLRGGSYASITVHSNSQAHRDDLTVYF